MCTPPRRRQRLYRRHVLFDHLEVVELAERVLCTLQRIDERPHRGDACVGNQLQRVAQLLRLDPYGVQLLGGVHLAHQLDRLTKPLDPMAHPGRQRMPPLGRIDENGDDGGFFETAVKLFGIEVTEAVKHHFAAAVPLGNHVRPDILEGVARELVGLSELIKNLDGDVHLTHRAQRLSQGPDLAFGLPPRLRFASENRHSFAQPPGGHPGQMDTGVVPRDRQRQLALEFAGPPQQ